MLDDGCIVIKNVCCRGDDGGRFRYGWEDVGDEVRYVEG